MMDSVRVCDVLALIAKISMDEAMLYMPIVHLAIAEVRSKIKEGKNPAQYEELLTYVCASHAYYRYAIIKCATQPSGSFSTNGVSVSGDNGAEIERARLLRDEMWRSASFLLEDNDEFAFCQMEG